MSIEIPPTDRQAIGRLTRAVIEAAITRATDASQRVGGLASAVRFDQPFGGVFVSLYVGDQLRGCIGRFDGSRPLADTLVEVAGHALQDPRFVATPWRVADLDDLVIEVSVLSPLTVIRDAGRLVAGVHGVVVSRGDRTGCLLPQVASSRDWSMEIFLAFCCKEKAGLDPDAWRDPGTLVRAFEATVIREAPGAPAARDLGC